ncbi:DUF6124 family protein [Pseudomonas vanderleydeniana]|uniref:DUF3077 domain-containing protein n=1 Tax=Pseudomonas vanderleydeniana TaxID=2745495 RepID=A0A9E6PR74_9PSED|nr:hypothetical protein [Pseudomonas vanderleydeniana]QXI31221.1 hypothetical protein HU752_015370 [Pseudomonas vanderleydeniana]
MIKKTTPTPCSTSSLEEKAAYLRKVMHDSLAQIKSTSPCAQTPALLETLGSTSFRSVEAAPSMTPLFCVQPGVSAQAALTQVSEMLRCAELNADEICPRLQGFERELMMGLIHSVGLSRAVVDALLDGAPSAT